MKDNGRIIFAFLLLFYCIVPKRFIACCYGYKEVPAITFMMNIVISSVSDWGRLCVNIYFVEINSIIKVGMDITMCMQNFPQWTFVANIG